MKEERERERNESMCNRYSDERLGVGRIKVNIIYVEGRNSKDKEPEKMKNKSQGCYNNKEENSN